MLNKTNKYRSSEWFDTPELYGWLRHAALHSQGFDKRARTTRPIIGICNSWSELTHCNAHLKTLAHSVKQGVWQAGGLPLEFPVMSLGEYNMRPSAMLYRNLMSMDVEESIMANPLDGVVLLGGCDKTTPALLMGAASANLPAILLTGGPQLKTIWRGEELGTCTDCRKYETEMRAGRLTKEDWNELQECIISSPGHCGVMGTASTMASLGESLGIALPGNGTIPAANKARLSLAEATGRQIVHLVKKGLRPSDLLTQNAFENTIRCLHAMGGSTNAIIHLIAIAGRLGIRLDLKTFDDLSKTTPFILNLKPAGQYLMEDFHNAGGVSAILANISQLLHPNTKTVTGKTLEENISGVRSSNNQVVRSMKTPLNNEGGLAILYGSLAPEGAIIKPIAASKNLLIHSGKAIVFENHNEVLQRIDDPNLEVRPDNILVMRNGGPIGGPGMPEWGLIPIPKKMLDQGINDMVRISDSRISGTAFGTVVIHISPESAIKGPLAAVQTGDVIELDVPNRKLDLKISQKEIENRLSKRNNNETIHHRGYKSLYTKHVLQADRGCDFDFLSNVD